MIVSTTNTIEGKKIVKTINAIEAENGFFAANKIDSARKNLEKKAEQLGANAIIGYRIDISPIPLYGGVHVYGTAVIVEEK